MQSTEIPVPQIYGAVTPEAARAYSNWMNALLSRAAHLLDCTAGCDVFDHRCLVGIDVHEAEQAAWRDWHAAYRASEVSA